MEFEKMMFTADIEDLEEISRIKRETLSTVRKLRLKLNDQGNLIDEFALGMLRAFLKISVFDAVETGFQNASDTLRELCIGIRDGNEAVSTHPFYPTLCQYISKHPCPKDSIYVDFYCASMVTDYAKFSLNEFIRNRKAALNEVAKEANIEQLMSRLIELVGQAEFDRLYDSLYRRFTFASPSRVFLQCMADQWVLNCLSQSGDSRYVFQYILDEENDD